MREQLTFDDNDELIHAWSGVMKRLAPDVPKGWYSRFLKDLRPLSLEGDVAVIGAPGKFVYDWIRERFMTQLEAMLSDELGRPVSMELRMQANERKAVPKPARPSDPVAVTPVKQPEVSSFKPNERYSFDTFVVGQSNRLAYAGAKAVAATPGERYNPLFIYGPPGLGKTHLLHAMAQEMLKHRPKQTVAFVSAQQFAEEFINALQANKVEQFRRQQRSVEVWLVDDIQFVAGKDKTMEEIFHTFNALQQTGKQIVLTSDRPPRELHLMDERLRSRFEAGLVADIKMPDTETRCAIILSKAQQEGVQVAHDVAMFLAESVPGNIRVLEGALTKLVAHASVDEREPDMDLAIALVDQYYRSSVLAKPGFETIVSAISKHYKISQDDILGTSRKAPIVHARHIAVYVTREITKDSWKHIATQFGNRDHTSMMHGYQKISEMMHRDRDLRQSVKTLIRDLFPEVV
jgi:chromosomal replication initiator protein